MDIKKIGERIKQARTLRNFTLDDIANEIGVAKSTVQRYENGLIGKPKLPVLQAIADSLKVNPSWISGKDVPMERDNHTEYWENEKQKEISYHDFLHSYFKYDSPYTLDGYVNIILKSEPDVIYRVTEKEYDDFYDFTKERIEKEFEYLLKKSVKIEECNSINNKPETVLLAAHNDHISEEGQLEKTLDDMNKLKRMK